MPTRFVYPASSSARSAERVRTRPSEQVTMIFVALSGTVASTCCTNCALMVCCGTLRLSAVSNRNTALTMGTWTEGKMRYSYSGLERTSRNM